VFQAVFAFLQLIMAFKASKPGLGHDQMRDILIAYSIVYISLIGFFISSSGIGFVIKMSLLIIGSNVLYTEINSANFFIRIRHIFLPV